MERLDLFSTSLRAVVFLALLGVARWSMAGGGPAPSDAAASTSAQDSRPNAAIMDNSFFLEEAFNQEPGVVQHIMNAYYGFEQLPGSDSHTWALSFTQEWPVPNQRHQFSYTVPYFFQTRGSDLDDGFGDILLNYRFQAYYDEKSLRGLAPRFSLVLPTGDSRIGFGKNALGYQWNLPFSTAIGDRWWLHVNAGLTFLPDAGDETRRDLLLYNLGGSVIYAASRNLNFLVEWIGVWEDTLTSNWTKGDEFATWVSPGIRWALNFSGSTQVVIGIACPISLTRPTPDIGGFLYLSFEHRVWGDGS